MKKHNFKAIQIFDINDVLEKNQKRWDNVEDEYFKNIKKQKNK